MMSNWYATFKELRVEGIPLQAWLEFHKARRAMLTPTQRRAEEK